MKVSPFRVLGTGLVLLLLALAVTSLANAGKVDVTLESPYKGSVYTATISGNYAYIGQLNDLVVVDISNQSNRLEVGRVNTPSAVYDIDIEGNYAYIADSIRGLVIVDISNPSSPTLKGSYETYGDSKDVAVAGNYAYIADSLKGLVIVDISNPSSPTLKGSYLPTGFTGWANRVAVAGNYAYLADSTNGLEIVDISNPSSPTHMGSYRSNGYATDYANDVAVVGNYAYLAYGYNGLVIVNISSPSSPTLEGSYRTGLKLENSVSRGQAYRVAVAGNYAYLADLDYGLVIVNVTNPTLPTLATVWYNDEHGIPFSSSPQCVSVSGNHVYLPLFTYGLIILRVDVPSGINNPPIAAISSISPNPAVKGETVTFIGSGTDTDGTITGFEWSSGINGLDSQLSKSASFSTTDLSLGTHTIYFRIQDDDGAWSELTTATVTIIERILKTRTVDVNGGADYTSIQAAVNDANPSDTIIVKPGTYIENVDVNIDNLTIRSESGSELTTVQALNSEEPVFQITANSTTIDGFNIRGSVSESGVYLYNVMGCNILNNDLLNNMYGVMLVFSNSNTLKNNKVSNKLSGILLGFSDNNALENCSISNNEAGIYLLSSNNNALKNNNLSNNKNGIMLNSSSYNLIFNNLFNNTNNTSFSGTGTVNVWNTTKTAGTNIMGGPFLGGNYWAKPEGTGFSQTHADSDGDGMCDESNIMANNIDHLPLSLWNNPPASPTPSAANADLASDDSSNSDGGDSGNSGGGGSSSSGSGGGGGGGSPEPQENVEAKELSQVFIASGKAVRFDFPKNVTCVSYVGFDAKKTAAKTTTIAEMLKGKSALVSELPSGEVYRSFNVWVGNGDYATPKNIENPLICFKVEKTWIQDKSIDPASISLNWYNDNKRWEALTVSRSGEDENYLYLTAKVSKYSSFAITGEAKNASEQGDNIKIRGEIQTNSTNGTKNISKSGPKTPGFEMAFGIACLLVVFLYRRKQ